MTITTQFPIDTWHDIIGDPTLADAICDRVIHNAHKIMLKPGDLFFMILDKYANLCAEKREA